MFQRWQFFIVAALLSGCGRPATVEDCGVIVDRVARLQIQESRPLTAPEVVEREVKTEKTLLKQRIEERCVGKRITEKTLKCVQSATTSSEIVETCFD